ncbi:MAG: M12 family metallopeptidase [Candidatus Sericytochromatia bacterium]
MAAKATGRKATAKKASAPAKKAAKKTTGPRVRERAALKPLRYCNAPPAPVLQLPPEVMANPERQRAIIALATKWMNNTVLHYAFFKSGRWKVPPEQAAVIRKAFKLWQDLPIGIRFAEVDSLGETEIRIGYAREGSWSYVGRQILDKPLNERTMNFGWPLDRDDYGLTTAIHEIGHTLGMPHEHQNPFAGIVWNEEAVYKYLGGPPNNWPRETTFHNVLRKIDPAEVTGSNWDPDSVMEYQFPAGLINEPADYRNGIFPPGTLSPLDKTWAQTWYPATGSRTRGRSEPRLRESEAVTVDLAAGEQIDYVIRVDETRKYTIGTFGATDTLLTLFEEVDGQPRFLAGDDDSGSDRTASISHRLRPGRTYHVRMRVIYKGSRGTVTLMYW